MNKKKLLQLGINAKKNYDLRHGFTKNVDKFAKGFDLTLGTAKPKEIIYGMSNTFGFGGHVATVLLKKFNP